MVATWYEPGYLYGDDEDVQRIWLLGGGERLPLALQLGHLHPLAAEEGVLALHVPDGDQQHVAVAVLDGLVVHPPQVVSAQKVLEGFGIRYGRSFREC